MTASGSWLSAAKTVYRWLLPLLAACPTSLSRLQFHCGGSGETGVRSAPGGVGCGDGVGGWEEEGARRGEGGVGKACS